MHDIAIRLTDVSKTYRGNTGLIRAVHNVTATIKRGEALGIVGRNGCGKSTLMKMIGGIIKPSSGKIEVQGNILPIVEVGAAFHPELTGEENILLNGYLLGWSKSEIKRILPQVLEFGELGKFIHEPVKNYSQGMFLRLAFSLMAHLPYDIVLLDEVLSVGDSKFRHKCYEKIQEFKQDGKTLLIVSHIYDEIASLCDLCMVLHNGTCVALGTPADTFNIYQESLIDDGMQSIIGLEDRFEYIHVGYMRIRDVHIYNLNDKNAPIVFSEPIVIEVEWEKLTPEGGIYFDIQCMDIFNRPVWHTSNYFGKKIDLDPAPNTMQTGIFTVRCVIPACFMNFGSYYIIIQASQYIDKENNYTILKTTHPIQLFISNNYQEEQENKWTHSQSHIRTNIFNWEETEILLT